MNLDLLELYPRDIPHIIKYMGSKRNILDFVIEAINKSYNGGKLYDLFSGTSILSGALGKLIPIHSNDIQEYSAVLAATYLSDYDWEQYSMNVLEDITDQASSYIEFIGRKFPELSFSYANIDTLVDFVELEEQQKRLLQYDFNELPYHLFMKFYSGTYWSYDQCLWIDALRKTADNYASSPLKYVILSSLMFAMSYTSQSTGHFAQYRDAKDISSLEDIFMYRKREILPLFEKKFCQLRDFLKENKLKYSISSLDFADCLEQSDSNSLVYADPPYVFVHYSRFYHALETLVKYDYPKVSFKGRYRSIRHQSPFCKRSEVKDAFLTLFSKIKRKNSKLILSYSNTGMVSLGDILEIAEKQLGRKYEIEVKEVAYKHSTMGRKSDKDRNVKEYLIIAS